MAIKENPPGQALTRVPSEKAREECRWNVRTALAVRELVGIGGSLQSFESQGTGM